MLKQLLLQVLPHIIDKMEQQNEIVGGAPREKRGLWIQDDVKPQSRTCNTLAKINSYYQIFINVNSVSILNYVCSFHFTSVQPRAEGKETINWYGLELESASGRVWKKALEKTLGEQNMYNTAMSSLVKGALRWVAWSIFAIGVHGPEHLFSY